MKIFINGQLLTISDEKINVINESGSLGDALAWIPIINEFAIKERCKVNLFTPFKQLFNNQYPLINFYDYKDKFNYKFDSQKIYKIGCFDNIPWKTMNLQEIASRTLNLQYKECKPKINKNTNLKNKFNKKYICIATQSTAQCKYWNNENGWQKVVDYLKFLNYEVVCIDRYENFGIHSSMNYMPKNCINKTGNFSLEDRINDLLNCDFFIGLSSGLSWLAWTCDKPVILISGFTDSFHEFKTPYRVINKNVCNSCWHDQSYKFDASNWLWCPRNKNFECSKEITFEMVKEKIDQCINDLKIDA